MSSFKSFLMERSSTPVPKDMLVDMLKSQCMPFIDELGGFSVLADYPLWRGTSHVTFTHTAPVRKDRIPLNTPQLQSSWIDGWFADTFGFRPRSQGVFLSGNKAIASQYGSPFVVVPVGELKYVWSPKVKDLFDDLVHSFGTKNLAELSQPEIIDFMESSDYHSDRLLDGVKGKVEIAIVCDSILLISPEDFRNEVEMRFYK
jgi:hypothetical protein